MRQPHRLGVNIWLGWPQPFKHSSLTVSISVSNDLYGSLPASDATNDLRSAYVQIQQRLAATLYKREGPCKLNENI